MERQTIGGYSPVSEKKIFLLQFLSSVEHEKFGVNLPRPLGKAKYFFTPIVHSTVRER